MSFTITISNVPDEELGPLLAQLRLPTGSSYETHYKPDKAGPVPKSSKRTPKRKEKKTRFKRTPSSTKVSMTGVVPKAGTSLALGLEVFEKMEATHGIGTVSKDDLMQELVKLKQHDKLASRLLRDGFLEYLT